MSSEAVVRAVLLLNQVVIAAVPAERIMAGNVPQKTIKPAIGIAMISSVPWNSVDQDDDNETLIDRVQVTAIVNAASNEPAGTGLPGVHSLLYICRRALKNRKGTFGDFKLDSIIFDQRSQPYEDLALGMHWGSNDYILKWSRAL